MRDMGSLEMVDFESGFRQKGQFAVSIIMRSAGPEKNQMKQFGQVLGSLALILESLESSSGGMAK